MGDLKLTELTLTELRAIYPNISARSKDDMLVKIAESTEVAEEEIVSSKEDKTVYDSESDTITWYNFEQFILQEAKTKKKILVRVPSSIEADLLYLRSNQEVFPKLNAQEISIMSSSSRRDMHLNGTCYIRLVCQSNFDHIKRLMKYTDFKDIV